MMLRVIKNERTMKRTGIIVLLLMIGTVLLIGCANTRATEKETNNNASADNNDEAGADAGSEYETPDNAEEYMDVVLEMESKVSEVMGLYISGPEVDAENWDMMATPYAEVIDENYKSLEDVKSKTETVFTRACAQELLYTRYLEAQSEEEGNNLFVEEDGKLLYLAGAAVSSILPYDTETRHIIECSDEKIVVMYNEGLNDLQFPEIQETMEYMDGAWYITNTLIKSE